MPQFQPTHIQNVKYEKRTRPAPTDANPTMTSLMSARDRKDFVSVTIPEETAAFDVAFEPIMLNAHSPFLPGKTYSVPPVVAAELRASIKNFEDAIILQMSKKNKAAQAAGIVSADAAFDEANMISVS